MIKGNKVLFITQEITPYVASSDMAEVGRNLSQAIQEKGYEIRTFMPEWGNINERRNQLHEVIRLSGINIIIDDTDHPLIIKVASIQAARMQIYFIDNDDYFENKLQTADENGVEYEDNDGRTIFYARGVLETVKKLHWCPDIVHCQGWVSALVPLYIKKAFKDEPSFRDTKVVFSLFDDEFKSTFPEDYVPKLQVRGIAKKDIAKFTKKGVDYTSLCKMAVEFADGIMINSPHVNEEVLAYARERNKPILDYMEPSLLPDAADAFYEQLLQAGKPAK
jgi:starch synthase